METNIDTYSHEGICIIYDTASLLCDALTRR